MPVDSGRECEQGLRDQHGEQRREEAQGAASVEAPLLNAAGASLFSQHDRCDEEAAQYEECIERHRAPRYGREPRDGHEDLEVRGEDDDDCEATQTVERRDPAQRA